jgi:hypothetical protein
VKAYVFGDRFLAFDFKEAVNNHIVDRILVKHQAPWFTATQYAIENLPKGHFLVEFLLDATCKFWNSAYIRPDDVEARKRCSPSFLMHLLECCSDRLYSLDDGTEDLDACSYHEHASELDRLILWGKEVNAGDERPIQRGNILTYGYDVSIRWRGFGSWIKQPEAKARLLLGGGKVAIRDQSDE